MRQITEKAKEHQMYIHFNSSISKFDTIWWNALWKMMTPIDIDPKIVLIKRAIAKVAEWMRSNKLKLNCDKTEFLIFGSKRNLEKCNVQSINICGETGLKTPCARNLGVMMDEELSMLLHVNHVAKTCRFHLRALWKIRNFLCEDTTKSMVHAVIISKLDYCNGILINLPDCVTRKLQLIMNEAARLITYTPRTEHIEPVLFHLHWLPIKWRFQYKITTMTFKALHNQAPKCIKNLLHPYTPSRGLRSSSKYLLQDTIQSVTDLELFKTLRHGYGTAYQLTSDSTLIWNFSKKTLKRIFFSEIVSSSYINSYHAHVSALVSHFM